MQAYIHPDDSRFDREHGCPRGSSEPLAQAFNAESEIIKQICKEVEKNATSDCIHASSGPIKPVGTILGKISGFLPMVWFLTEGKGLNPVVWFLTEGKGFLTFLPRAYLLGLTFLPKVVFVLIYAFFRFILQVVPQSK